MSERRGLLIGAGVSAGPPASLPLGAALSDRLRECCCAAAEWLTPDAVDARGIAAAIASRTNVLVRLEEGARAVRHAGGAAGADVHDLLRCFRVGVPNEEHLLAATHAARGNLVVTLNLDDGIERAYALISGAAELPADAPAEYRGALAAWREAVRAQAPLRVAASYLAAADYDHRPLLVKLRGSADQGWHQRLLAGPDADELADDQLTALRALAATDHVAVIGFSADDRDCRGSLLPLLRRGRFSWTAAALPPSLVDTLRRIDPAQPVLRPSLYGLRASLPEADALPPWPRLPLRGGGFDACFARWQGRFPVAAAAAAYALLLTDAGLPEQAEAVWAALPASPA